MAHNISIPSKPYSSLHSDDGVPISELVDLLGAETRSLLADRTVNGISNLQTASRIAGQAVNIIRHDKIEVDIVSSTSVLLGRWEVDIDSWIALTSASDSDTISVAGGTAYDAGTILIGRSGTDRVLVQADTFTTNQLNFVVNVYGITRDSGLLGRRLSGSGTNHSKPYIALTRTNSTPTLPAAAEFRYNGITLTHTPDGANPTFTDPNVSLASGSGHLYAVTLQLIYDHYTSTWSVDTGSIITQSSISDLGFAASEEATTWMTTPVLDDEQWVRIRDEDGNFVYIQTRTADAPTSSIPFNWVPTEFARFNPSAGTPQVISSVDFDWSGYTFLEVVYVQYDSSGNTILRTNIELYPAFRFSTVLATNAAQDQPQSLQGWFSTKGSGIHRGTQNARSSADVDNQAVRINFSNTTDGGAAGLKSCDTINVDVGFSDYRWICVLRIM